MRCEVCGKEIMGPPQRQVIEGAKLTVCGKCAQFGSSECGTSRPAPVKAAPSGWIQTSPQPAPRKRVRNDVETVESLELIEDYGKEIRKARRSKKVPRLSERRPKKAQALVAWPSSGRAWE